MLIDARPGAFIISFGLPLLCYTFVFLCNDVSGCPTPLLLHPSSFSLEELKREVHWPGISGLVTTDAVLGTLGYYLFSLTLYAFLPATETEGTVLNNGSRLKYRFNGMCTHVTLYQSPHKTVHSADQNQLSAQPSSP
jgi:delta14-sterol reductase